MLPSTTFCFNLIQVIDWQKLTHEERVSILQDGLGNNIFKDYNVQEETEESVKGIPLIVKTNSDHELKIAATSNIQMLNMSRVFDVTYKFEDMFESICTYMEEYAPAGVSRGYVQLKFTVSSFYDIFNVNECIKDMYRCYSMEYKEKYRLVNYYHLARQGATPGLVSAVEFNRDRLNNTLGMYFLPNHSGRKPASGFYAVLPMASTISQLEHITYDIFEAKLLKAPYETKCIDYTELGFEFRGECYESCLRNETISATGKIHPSVNIFGGENRNVIKFADVSLNYNNTRTLLNELEDICDRRCQAKDCFSVTYIPKKLASLSGPDVHSALVVNLAPQAPIVRAVCQEALTLIQYLTDIASTVGFWLGISAFGFFHSTKKTLEHASQAFSANQDQQEKGKTKGQQVSAQKFPSTPWVLIRCPVASPDPGWRAVKMVSSLKNQAEETPVERSKAEKSKTPAQKCRISERVRSLKPGIDSKSLKSQDF